MPTRKRIGCRAAQSDYALHARRCSCEGCRHVFRCKRPRCRAVIEREEAAGLERLAREQITCPDCGRLVVPEPEPGAGPWPDAAKRIPWHEDTSKRGHLDPGCKSIGLRMMVYPTCKSALAPLDE